MARKEDYSKDVDVWSLGVINFAMLQGRLPYKGDSEEEIMKNVMYEEIQYDLKKKDIMKGARMTISEEFIWRISHAQRSFPCLDLMKKMLQRD